MNVERARWSRRYQTALRKHIEQGAAANLLPTQGLGRKAVALGLETLDVARVHEQALLALALPHGASAGRQGMIRRANLFFSETIVPIEKTHRAARKTDGRVHQLMQVLRRRTVESSTSTRHLKRSIIQRQKAEISLEESGNRHATHLAEARHLQKHLRLLTHACLAAQEHARKSTSRRLYDEIAQTLLAINLRLLVLKASSKANTKNLKKEIANTQRLVKQSEKRVNGFAHEFTIPQKT